MIQISKPTVDQNIRTAKIVIVAFVATFATVWTQQPDPFSKAAVIAAVAAGGVAAFHIIESILTDL